MEIESVIIQRSTPTILTSHKNGCVVSDQDGDLNLISRDEWQLKLLSWNIGGWKNKLYDSEFLSFLQEHDILCIQEIWSQESDPPTIQGYQAFSVPAIRTSVKGRGSGGLVIFLNVDLKIDVQVLKKLML